MSDPKTHTNGRDRLILRRFNAKKGDKVPRREHVVRITPSVGHGNGNRIVIIIIIMRTTTSGGIKVVSPKPALIR